MTELEKIEQEELAKAFRDILKLAAGKRVLYWLLDQCAIYQEAYAGDNNATNYMLGRQAIGRRVIAKLDEIDPRFYPKLLLDIAEIRAMDREAAASMDQLESDDD